MTFRLASLLLPAILALPACHGCDGTSGNRPGGDGASAIDAARSDAPRPGGPPPNVLLILTDDQRAGTETCLDSVQGLLAAKGMVFRNSTASTPLCCPGRSSIFTGEYAHNHGVQTNGDGEEDPGEFIPGARDFQNHGNEAIIFPRWLGEAGYRTGLFGKYLNGYDELSKGLDAPYVPPHWDEWHAFREVKYYDFVLVERAAGDTQPRTTCYLSGPDTTDDRDADRCRRNADQVVEDGSENYSGEVLAGKTIDFMRQSVADGKPFFAYLALKSPHLPAASAHRYQPDPERDKFTDEAKARLADCPYWDWADRPPSYLEEDVSDQPAWVKAQKEKGVNPDDIDRTRRRQLVSLLTVDDEVAELVAALEDAGALDNTVILYSSDNGYSWGDHWWTKKNCSFDSCARVPMIAFDGRNPVARETDWPVMNIDLAPTILDLAGAAPPPDQKVNGTSFRSLVEGTGEPAARDAILTECWGDSQYGPDIHAAVRTSQWKYVEHYRDHEMTEIKTRLDGDEERELYDLVRDPSESENLSHRSPAELADLGYDADDIADTMAELAGRLAALRAQ